MAVSCVRGRWAIGVSVAALLAGCAAPPPPPPSAAVPRPLALAPPPPPAAAIEPRLSSVLGTPVLLVLKVPGCIASAVISAPMAAVYTLANQGEIPPEQDFYEDVDRANQTYCGPPSTVPP